MVQRAKHWNRSGELFIEASGQTRLIDKSVEQKVLEQRVECLGMTFESEDARRAYFLKLLQEKLKDPEFRKIEGFPIGADEDILALSDPPFYTACPNPFLEEFGQQHKPINPSDSYHIAEPFTFDVTEGKQDPVCMAHTYHTKVPYRAIARYILHYTRPDDLILDCFAGTGMTGVAAHICANPSRVFRKELEKERADASQPPPSWGRRFVVLSDLSPFATFLAHNFNSCTSSKDFAHEAISLLVASEEALGWMYETDDQETGSIGKIQYVIWSESVYCDCGLELFLWAPNTTVLKICIAHAILGGRGVAWATR